MTNEAISTIKFSCPICKKTVKRSNDDFPFCSPRCRTNDLGQWASGEYRIAGEPAIIPDDSEGY
ncbi:DNA gyrase inhibitor YacG [Mariprofundus sp. EBB-1]|uniref:DNA gyrase inhibitor YacG n=1 Tax=Mariprofundus sp. EBB-1 TaxID=2650971 RepID=UPI000EF19559|nr:DNA gyrase inhibitor YacG [Mariprofundus sp. EBB-1]RLL51079.1 DNA gyrase inhibitor YacG [Mariprofundus sp. EBB-1]